MATVVLRAPLRDLAGRGQISVAGSSVGEAMFDLQRTKPKLVGWILDEQGDLRPHVAVFVNGERAKVDTPVTEADAISVLPSISGGAR
jgi:molybdopterin synthase sulfur carrier subunit